MRQVSRDLAAVLQREFTPLIPQRAAVLFSSPLQLLQVYNTVARCTHQCLYPTPTPTAAGTKHTK